MSMSWIKAAAAAVVVAGPVYAGAQMTSPQPNPTSQPPTTRPATQPTTISPEARQVLDQVQQAYADLQSVELRGTIRSNVDVAGEQEQTEVAFTSAFRQPNLFRHEYGDQIVIGASEDKTYAHNLASNTYLLGDRLNAETPIQDLPAPIPQLLRAQDPSLYLALAHQPLETVLGGSVDAEVLPDEQIDNTDYTVVRLSRPEFLDQMTLYIDPQTHLIRQVVSDASQALQARGIPDVKQAQLTISYDTINTSANLAPDRFTWNPPEGAQDIAQARPAAEQQGQRLIGQSAPEFTLESLKGESVSLSDYRGQIVLLDFWATWCPPCVESLPHLGELYKEQGDDVKVFAVNLQENRDTVQQFIDQQQLDVPVLLDEQGQVSQQYGVTAIPMTVLIGPEGKVQQVFTGFGPNTSAQILRNIELLKSADELPAGDRQAPTTQPQPQAQ